jgi:hypothetical protein
MYHKKNKNKNSDPPNLTPRALRRLSMQKKKRYGTAHMYHSSGDDVFGGKWDPPPLTPRALHRLLMRKNHVPEVLQGTLLKLGTFFFPSLYCTFFFCYAQEPRA